jgi:DNA-binding MarR family transcriptional regulator
LRSTPAARAAGLTPTKTSILLALARGGPTRLADLGDSEGINPTMLSRVVAGLVEANLLERTSDAGDRRQAWVSPTTQGLRLAERIRRERTEAVEAALAELSAEQRRRLEASLPALEALAEQLKDVRG